MQTRSMVNSNPASFSKRAAVSNAGDLRPCSYADSVGREVCARAACACWLNPAACRASVSSCSASIATSMYPKGYVRAAVGGKLEVIDDALAAHVTVLATHVTALAVHATGLRQPAPGLVSHRALIGTARNCGPKGRVSAPV